MGGRKNDSKEPFFEKKLKIFSFSVMQNGTFDPYKR